MTQTLLTIPPALSKFIHGPGKDRLDWLKRLSETPGVEPFIGTDPVGHRLGSGGGTVYLLYQAWKSAEKAHELESWLEGEQKLILHAGGESRRLPAYAAVGKAFIPLPSIEGLSPRMPEQLLADFQLPGYRQTLVESGSRMKALVTSGDVWLDFDPADIPEIGADISGVGMRVSSEVAQHFGVYFVRKESRKTETDERPISFFRQKPSVSEILKETARYDFFVDTGMWLLSAKALKFLFKRCGWNPRLQKFATDSGLPEYLDLYTEVGGALGMDGKPDRALKQAGFAELTSSVIPLTSARFYHLGSTRQLLESMEQLQWQSLTPQRAFRVATTESQAPSKARGLTWVEGSLLSAPLQLDGSNVVTGIPFEASVLRLGAEQCLDVVPVGESEYVLRPYHMEDSLRGPLASASICGRRAADWFSLRGWPAEPGDVFNIPIYPILGAREITPEAVDWFFSAEPSVAISREFRKRKRLSASDIPNAVNFSRYFAQRETGYAHGLRAAFETANSDGQGAVFDQDFAALASFCNRRSPDLKRWILAHSDEILAAAHRPEHQARFLTFLSELAKGRAKRSWAQSGFDRLQSALVSSHQLAKSSPHVSVKEDQIVWARSPVRLDLAGGWTDTPPFCLEAGGSVLNVAVLLNGQPPIQAFVRPTREEFIRLRSIDLGSSETVTDFNGLADFRNPGGHFSLPKAALALAGFLPQFLEGSRYRTLRAQLKAFGGGLEISLLSAVPKGSGLGTSSILGATLLGAINRACGLGWDEIDLYNRVLGVEQLLTTGGGWQDQAGALFPSIKLVQTQPGLSQLPSVRYVPVQAFDGGAINRSYLLYYTGATRMAKGILQQIVRDMFLGDARTRRTLEAIRANAAKTYHSLQLGDASAVRRAIGRSWRLNKELDSGTTTPEIELIIQKCGIDLAACKLLGAGGGGYMLLCAQDSAAGDRIRTKLEANPPNRRARFIDFTVSQVGMQVSVS